MLMTSFPHFEQLGFIWLCAFSLYVFIYSNLYIYIYDYNMCIHMVFTIYIYIHSSFYFINCLFQIIIVIIQTPIKIGLSNASPA